VAITGAHALLYTPEAEALRATLRDVFGWHHVDAGDGWLIFALPPAELGVHPSDGATKHELSLMCDDVQATVAELRAQGIEFRGEPEDMGFGTGLTMLLPGGVEVLLYEPQLQTAIGRSRPEAAG
jgi:catechol 2,3-dioxygenase-like lactoylglutathione lyase family enzyme